jgi:hypothetical protein
MDRGRTRARARAHGPAPAPAVRRHIRRVGPDRWRTWLRKVGATAPRSSSSSRRRPWAAGACRGRARGTATPQPLRRPPAPAADAQRMDGTVRQRRHRHERGRGHRDRTPRWQARAPPVGPCPVNCEVSANRGRVRGMFVSGPLRPARRQQAGGPGAAGCRARKETSPSDPLLRPLGALAASRRPGRARAHRVRSVPCVATNGRWRRTPRHAWPWRSAVRTYVRTLQAGGHGDLVGSRCALLLRPRRARPGWLMAWLGATKPNQPTTTVYCRAPSLLAARGERY